MKPDTFPLQLLLATFSGWVNRQQAEAIGYLREENRVLKEQLKGKRLRLTDDQSGMKNGLHRSVCCRQSRPNF